MNLKKHIPNAITCLNLLSGCLAVIFIARARLDMAAYLIFIAAFFDLLDGMAARILNIQSPIGKQLDSLADVISFGLVPGLILVNLLSQSNMQTITTDIFWAHKFIFIPLIIPVFSALRLAKFNIDTRQTNSFLGLPVPANAILLASFPLILMHDEFDLTPLITNPYFIICISVVMSLLLVSEIPLFSLKFKNFSWKENSAQYSLILSSAILLFTVRFAAIPIIIFLYILLSLFKSGVRSSVTGDKK